MAESMRIVLFGLLLYLAMTGAVYYRVRVLGSRGPTSAAKRQPYACGQDLTPSGESLSYRRFYRLALLFMVVHMGALVAMLLPQGSVDARLAVAYLLGIGVCVDILTRGGD
jgi:NADH:ubiquinone oxidoreductase subunit 3 (subunit A)